MTTKVSDIQAAHAATTKHVVVIGAEIIGAASAIELLRDGHRVTLVEPGEPGGEQAASYGNGACLSPSSVLPMSFPGIWKKVPGYVLDPLGPLAIRWRYFPRMIPWLLRFIGAGSTEAKLYAAGQVLRPLVINSPERHKKLAEEAGVGDLIQKQGLLYAYPRREDFEADSLAWRVRADTGVKWLELDENELRQREPALSRRYTFGVLVEEGGQCLNPGGYVAALVRHALNEKAELRRVRATGFRIENGRLRAVRTDAGDIACDKAVICAGAWSKALAAEAGDHVVMESERGYHVLIDDPVSGPRNPVLATDAKGSITMTAGKLRIAGQVELAGLQVAPNWQRAQILLDILKQTFPALGDVAADKVKFWMGHRPATPDALPVIGPASACADIVYGFGHGHVGLAAGPVSGRIIADLVSGKPPVVDPAPYSARRFS